jgi:hypothetical protein
MLNQYLIGIFLSKIIFLSVFFVSAKVTKESEPENNLLVFLNPGLRQELNFKPL